MSQLKTPIVPACIPSRDYGMLRLFARKILHWTGWTIVGELPTGAVAGLGARLLAGSYYGQTIQIWSALILAAVLAATLVAIIGLIQRITLKRMGMA